MKFRAIIPSLFLLLALPYAQAADLPGIPGFIDEMVSRHQFRREELVLAFSKAERRQDIIDAITTPATTKPWDEYRAIFVNQKNIRKGLKFWNTYPNTLRRAEKQFGVPPAIIVALLAVETQFGKNTGKFRTLDALTTLAFDYPRRARFFRGELEEYLLLARDQDFDLLQVRGSYAGALGIPQFMPSNYLKYGVDFNHDRKIDLLHSKVDTIGSVANYLSKFGWKRDEPISVRVKFNSDECPGNIRGSHTVTQWRTGGFETENQITGNFPARLIDFTVGDDKEFWLGFNNFDTITHYNNSDYYAMSVLQLAQALEAAKAAN